MHHNSQKRISISQLFWDLGDLALIEQRPLHPSFPPQHLYTDNNADSANQTPSLKVLSQLFSFIVYFGEHCIHLPVSAPLMLPSSLTHPLYVISTALHKRLPYYIQQYHWR